MFFADQQQWLALNSYPANAGPPKGQGPPYSTVLRSSNGLTLTLTLRPPCCWIGAPYLATQQIKQNVKTHKKIRKRIKRITWKRTKKIWKRIKKNMKTHQNKYENALEKYENASKNMKTHQTFFLIRIKKWRKICFFDPPPIFFLLVCVCASALGSPKFIPCQCWAP